MAQAVRSFLAIELSDTLKSEAELFLESTREKLAGFRLIPSQNWHVTLHFLGPVELQKIEQLTSHLPAALTGIKPFPISLRGFSAFPSAQNPRILWIGVDSEVQSLLELKRRLDTILQKLHFEIETRPFHPHITVGRLKAKYAHSVSVFNQEFRGKAVEQVQQLTLLKSTLSVHGATYVPLQIFRF